MDFNTTVAMLISNLPESFWQVVYNNKLEAGRAWMFHNNWDREIGPVILNMIQENGYEFNQEDHEYEMFTIIEHAYKVNRALIDAKNNEEITNEQ